MGPSKRSLASGLVSIAKWNDFLQKKYSYRSEMFEFTELVGRKSVDFCKACAKIANWTNIRGHCTGKRTKVLINEKNRKIKYKEV